MQAETETFLTFRARLSDLLAERKISNTELARAVGVSHVAIGNYLKDQMPRADVLMKLSAYFGVSMDSFFEGMAVRERPESATEHWKHRAQVAEAKVEMLKAGMVGLLRNI